MFATSSGPTCSSWGTTRGLLTRPEPHLLSPSALAPDLPPHPTLILSCCPPGGGAPFGVGGQAGACKSQKQGWEKEPLWLRLRD